MRRTLPLVVAAVVVLGGCGSVAPDQESDGTASARVTNPFEVLDASLPSVPSLRRDVREPMPVPSDSAAVSAATSTPAPPAPVAPAPVTRVSFDTVGIGDSVMLGAGPVLTALGMSFDATVSRQFWDAPAVVAAQAAPGRTLVIHIGTNGNPTTAQFDAMMSAAAPADRVLLLTVRMPRVWEAASNDAIRSGAARWPGEAAIVDWHAASADRPDWFSGDGVHLTSAGADAYASLIASAVG